MSDALLFYKLGWQGIWKQKIIFLYYAVFLFANQFSPYFNYLQDNFLWLRCLLIPFDLLIGSVSLIAGPIGEIFIAHKITHSEPILFDDIVQSIKKHFWRFLKLLLLLALIFILPFFVGYFMQYWAQSLQPNQYIVFSWFFVSVVSTGLWLFIFAEFLIKNKGIIESLSSAWKMFSKHFSVLVTMGMISFGIWYISSLFITGVFELIQSNFSINAFSKIDFLFPGTRLRQNLAHLLITYIVSIFSQAFTVTSFIYAYNQYSPREEQTGKKIIRKQPK